MFRVYFLSRATPGISASIKYLKTRIFHYYQELRQHNLAVKTNAVTKLTYLQMLGYDISWASFNIIEVMSSTRFTEKRIGYLAACQSFHQDTEVITHDHWDCSKSAEACFKFARGKVDPYG
jgi:hypothetical protein